MKTSTVEELIPGVLREDALLCNWREMFLGKKVSISAYAFLAYVTDGMAEIKVGDQETHHTDEWASLFLSQGDNQVRIGN